MRIRLRDASRALSCARRRPAVAVLGIALHLVATVGASFHLAFVQHERCPEHGELIHGDEVGARPTPADPGSDAGPAAISGSSRGEYQHDLCSIVVATREHPLAAGAAASGEAPEILAVLAAVRAADRSSDRARYRLAPKTSPPPHRV